MNHLRFSPDGELAATSSDDGTVRLWHTATGMPRWRAPAMFESPPEIFTQLGWLSLDSPAAPRPSRAPTRWRRAIEERALASSPGVGGELCLRTTDERLEVWDTAADRLVSSTHLPGLTEVRAMPSGCVSLAAGQVRLHARPGPERDLAAGAGAVVWDHGELLVAAGPEVAAFDGSGTRKAVFVVEPGVTALVRAGEWLVLGYREGQLQLVPLTPGGRRPSFGFEGLPASPVTRLLAGPAGTVVAGFANGVLGIWVLDTGAVLDSAKLHGPVVYLVVANDRLYAGTELGDYLVLDLGDFYRSHCELLRQVWRTVPIVWEKGLPVRRPPPDSHRCQGVPSP